MTNSSTPNPGDRKLSPFIWIILALIVLFLVYRACQRQPPSSSSEPGVTPPADVTTPTLTPTTSQPVATAVPTPEPTCPPAACGNWIIEVGPEPTQLYANGKPADTVCIGMGNTIRWIPKTGSTGLKIFFQKDGFPSSVGSGTMPFGAMHFDQKSQAWEFNAQTGPNVFSGYPNTAFGQPGQKYCIKYSQSINGKTEDGRIIIQR